MWEARMDWRERIVVDAGDESPVVRGTQLAVEPIAELLDTGWRLEQVLASFPELSAEDVRACVAFTREFRLDDYRLPVAQVLRPANSAVQMAFAVA
jgi:uncharacterized protein (DUF433 family)